VVRIVETLVWWPPLCGLWLLTLSTFPRPELVAAVVLSLPCAAAATVARRAVGASWRPRARWLRWLPPLPGAVLADTGRVLLRVLRRPVTGAARGRLRQVTLPEESDAAHTAAQRALAVIALSLPPGSVVIGAGDGSDGSEGDELTLHVLAEGPPHLREVIER
jgi:hypothetical protein